MLVPDACVRIVFFFFFSSRRRHTRCSRDWSSDVCSSDLYLPDGKLRVYRSRSGGTEWEPLTKGLPQRDCYVNVLRDAMAVDSLEPCGVYFGTTGGQGFGSSVARDNLGPHVRDHLPDLSVDGASAP